MTAPYDPSDPGDPVLSEEEEREVTALLADSQGRGPLATPPEVVARLDDVLAGLVDSSVRQPQTRPAASVEGASVATLEEHRRRRRWPQVLLAAAAVLVVGYGVADLTSGGVLESGSADGAGGAASTADSGAVEERAHPGQEESGGGLAGADPMSIVPTVRRDHLAADVRRVVRLFGQHHVTQEPSAEASQGGVDELRDCPVPRLVEGQRLYQVHYRGSPAGLVVGPPQQGSVDVTVYSCEDGGVRLARTVPAP